MILAVIQWRFECDLECRVLHPTEKRCRLVLTITLSVRTKKPKNAHKNAQKGSKIFKSSIHNFVTKGTNLAKNMAFYEPIGCVRFARYCGKTLVRPCGLVNFRQVS